MVSVVPVYFVWIAPELFNFTLGVIALLLLAVQGGGGRRRRPPRCDGCSGHRSDVVAALVLGLATFSKVSNALMFPPDRHLASVAGAMAPGGRRRPPRSASSRSVCSPSTWRSRASGTIKAARIAARSTHEFPLQTPTSGFEVGAPRARNEALTEIIFNRSVFWTNLAHNLAIHSSAATPASCRTSSRPPLRCWLFLAAPRRRPMWQCSCWRRPGAAFLLRHRHTVHLARRRRLRRQSLLHGRVRGIPVPVAADLQRRHGGRAVDRGWALRRAAGAQSVRDVLLSRQLRGPRAVQDAARWS